MVMAQDMNTRDSFVTICNQLFIPIVLSSSSHLIYSSQVDK